MMCCPCFLGNRKGVELAVYISDKVPEMVIGDPGRFRQIITNLMGNSIKVTEKGHIFVTVHLVHEVVGFKEEEVESSSSNTLSGFPVADRRQRWVKFKAFDKEEGQSDFPPSSPNQVNIIVSMLFVCSGIWADDIKS